MRGSNRRDDIRQALEEMPDPELLTLLCGVLKDDRYEKNAYTDMMENISKRSGLTPNQRRAVETHLNYNSQLWF